jgi:hypothetical protein
MTIAIIIILLLIGSGILAYLFLEFDDQNSVEKESKRVWTDPKK